MIAGNPFDPQRTGGNDARAQAIAAVQMDAAPAPTPARLTRATHLADQAAAAGAQPPTRVPALAYVSSDIVLPRLVEPIYRRGVRRALGAHTAPHGAQKSAELTALLIWMNSHCNSCGRALTNENQPDRGVSLCANCSWYA